jgi:hypothetical protein
MPRQLVNREEQGKMIAQTSGIKMEYLIIIDSTFHHFFDSGAGIGAYTVAP